MLKKVLAPTYIPTEVQYIMPVRYHLTVCGESSSLVYVVGYNFYQMIEELHSQVQSLNPGSLSSFNLKGRDGWQGV